MVRLRLTVADLSRVRCLGTLGVDFEARLTELRLTENRLNEFTEWRRRVRRRVHRVSAQGTSTDRRMFRTLAVEPFWTRIRSHLEKEREALGRAVVAGAVEEALNDLHPAIAWHATSHPRLRRALPAEQRPLPDTVFRRSGHRQQPHGRPPTFPTSRSTPTTNPLAHTTDEPEIKTIRADDDVP